MGEKKTDWVGFQWDELGDTYIVVAQGEPERWLYQRSRDGVAIGGGIRTSADLVKCLPNQVYGRKPAPPAAAAIPADAGTGVLTADEVEAYTAIIHDIDNGHLQPTTEAAVSRASRLLDTVLSMQATIELQRIQFAATEAALAAARGVLEEIERMSDAGYIFEGLDECNEDTHEENAKVLLGTMDAVNEVARKATAKPSERGEAEA